MAEREILFRGKRVANGKWVEGHMFSQHNPIEFKDNFYIRIYDTDYLVIPETVGQYTGLTDKNGKRIFEGDIIVVEGEKWCVGYDDMRARFALFHTSWELMRNIPNYCEREVIGNIHDNSKILKGGGENG